MTARTFSFVTPHPPLVTRDDFVRAGAAARAGHAFGDAWGALEKRVFERVELIAKALAPACGDGGEAARGFKARPDVWRLHSYMSYMVT